MPFFELESDEYEEREAHNYPHAVIAAMRSTQVDRDRWILEILHIKEGWSELGEGGDTRDEVITMVTKWSSTVEMPFVSGDHGEDRFWINSRYSGEMFPNEEDNTLTFANVKSEGGRASVSIDGSASTLLGYLQRQTTAYLQKLYGSSHRTLP